MNGCIEKCEASPVGDGQESDVSSNASEPPDWNSDDEPPQDHVNDEQICSRDGAVKKVIRRIGHGLQRPGQYDRVHARYRILSGEGSAGELSPATASRECDEVGSAPTLFDVDVMMGEDRLPLAVEFALKCMRLGEVAEVVGPVAYGAMLSPLCGRKLRDQTRGLPLLRKVSRKLRFLPSAPAELAKNAKVRPSTSAESDGTNVPQDGLFRADVELVRIDSIQMLTEDRQISKQLLHSGHGLRTPRIGDLVTFSLAPHFSTDDHSLQYTLVLRGTNLPHEGLERVLLSMKEGEQCLARLPSGVDVVADWRTVERAAGAANSPFTSGKQSDLCPEVSPRESQVHVPGEMRLVVTMHTWQRRDTVPVPIAGVMSSAECPVLRKYEIRPGAVRLAYDIEHGSMVLIGIALSQKPGSQGAAAMTEDSILLSWRMGEGSVPGFLEAVVSSMRLAESAVIDVPHEALRCARTGPSYTGQTPLRRLMLPELRTLVVTLFDDRANGAGSCTTLFLESQLPCDWMTIGDQVIWDDLGLEKAPEHDDGTAFKVALFAATEATDVCMMDDDAQHEYLEIERAHGNSLAKLGRFAEASVAYSKALDAVRRTALYKALFPTEHGKIEGAYTRDPGENDSPLDRLASSDVDSWRASLVALHLNIALCARKEGKLAEARRHCTTVLGSDPTNAKAFFRRGSAAMSQNDFDEALADLQRATELEPQNRSIRDELHELQRRMRKHSEAEKKMFQNVFQPPPRSDAGTRSDVAREGPQLENERPLDLAQEDVHQKTQD